MITITAVDSSMEMNRVHIMCWQNVGAQSTRRYLQHIMYLFLGWFLKAKKVVTMRPRRPTTNQGEMQRTRDSPDVTRMQFALQQTPVRMSPITRFIAKENRFLPKSDHKYVFSICATVRRACAIDLRPLSRASIRGKPLACSH